MADSDEPVRAGRSLAGVDRWIERHEDFHVRERAERRTDIDNAEFRLQERMTMLERKQGEDHKASVMRIDDLGKLVDGIQSVIDQQRGAKNLLVVIGIGTIVNVGVAVLNLVNAARP